MGQQEVGPILMKLPGQRPGAFRARSGERDASKGNIFFIVPLPACR